jgi:CheY-like chemotaxis protein/DNA-directed RNA polymerase subunit RPC12/RpoP
MRVEGLYDILARPPKMNCPRCKTPIAPLSKPDAIITCPGCGSRLMTKAAARRSQGGRAMLPADPTPATHPPVAGTETVAPTASPSWLPPPSPRPPSPPSSPPLAPVATAPPAVAAGRRDVSPAPSAALDQILREIRAVRELQERIVAMLGGAAVGSEPPLPDAPEADASPLSAIRAPRKKSVLLIDDDPTTRGEAVRELTQADVPVRAVADGNQALRAIVEEKPDLIALELGLRGDMGGKDLVNVIKATMEWVDIPIVLWTRESVGSQKEARQIHGADELALKSGGPAGLLARVITIFRRG